MAETSTLARPYARAIFNLALTDNSLAAWSDTLALLKEVTANKSMVELFNNPDVSGERLISLIIDICKDEQV